MLALLREIEVVRSICGDGLIGSGERPASLASKLLFSQARNKSGCKALLICLGRGDREQVFEDIANGSSTLPEVA